MTMIIVVDFRLCRKLCFRTSFILLSHTEWLRPSSRKSKLEKLIWNRFSPLQNWSADLLIRLNLIKFIRRAAHRTAAFFLSFEMSFHTNTFEKVAFRTRNPKPETFTHFTPDFKSIWNFSTKFRFLMEKALTISLLALQWMASNVWLLIAVRCLTRTLN